MMHGYFFIFVLAVFAINIADTVYLLRHSSLQSEVPDTQKADLTANLTSQPHDGTGRPKTNDLQSLHQHQVQDNSQNGCVLEVKNNSVKYFSRNILRHNYNFVYLNLNFINVEVNETKYVINKQNWVWTYEGENGAHQYLSLPGDFGYLSFGLLLSHTMPDKVRVDIEKKQGDCSHLEVGNNVTDKIIGNALGRMTSQIAEQHDMYNASYWCYNRRVWLYSLALYYVCKNYVCTYQTFGYRCCRYYSDFITLKREVICEPEIYLFGALWWMLPIVLGHLGFAFYPILLTKIGMKVNAFSKALKTEVRTRSPRRLSTFTSQSFELDYHTDTQESRKYHFVSLKQPNPITFTSTIFSPVFRLDISGPFVSRAVRIWIIFLPMTLSVIRVCLDYTYASDLIKTAVSKGALVGFSSLLVGVGAAREHFLKILGGPEVALSIYIIFGCFVITFPANIETFLEKGLPNSSGKYLFLAQMPLKQKERFSGIQVRQFKGLKRIHHLFFAHTFLLLHWKFWKHAFKLFYLRWKTFQNKVANVSTCGAIILVPVVLPVYIIFCILELLLMILYFLFPVMNCFFILIKALGVAYFGVFRNRGCFLKLLRNLFVLPLFVLLIISWYMYCIIFFDGCWFLSKIAMFTYSGIFAYPKLSYGYIILAFMALYYLSESFNAFGENYRELLKLSIEVCEKFQSRYQDESDLESTEISIILTRHGIPSDLFYLIVNRTLPRRNQAMTTILKFACVLTILTISVDLLITFNKFQDLSLVSHVFTVLFICAMPKIIRMICTQNYKRRTRKILKQKIKKTIKFYVRNRKKINSGDGNDGIQITQGTGYDTDLEGSE